MKKLLRCTFTVLATFLSHSALAASAIGMISMMVTGQLGVEAISEMKFKPARPGAAAEILKATDSNSSGAFVVAGTPGASVQIVLPAETKLTLSERESRQAIRVTGFNSSVGNHAYISEDGKLFIAVGATREALPRTIKQGTYTGEYTLQVVY